MENFDNLTKEIDCVYEELGPFEEDSRLKNISNEEFNKSIKEAEEALTKEFEDIEERRLKAALNARRNYTLDK